MIRLVSTLVLTVVTLIGATIWWGSRAGSGPWPPLDEVAPPAAAAPEPAQAYVRTPEPARAFPPAPERAPGPARTPEPAPAARTLPSVPAPDTGLRPADPAAGLPPPTPAARPLPPVPAPIFAEPPAPAERTLELPVAAAPLADEPVEETLVRAPAEFVEGEPGALAAGEASSEASPALATSEASPALATSEASPELAAGEATSRTGIEPAAGEPAGVESTVAMSPAPARVPREPSADLIRRLLGIYDSLGRSR